MSKASPPPSPRGFRDPLLESPDSRSPSPKLRAVAGLRELAREHPISLRVRGSCMAPLLADGSQIEVAAASFYWPGDVVAFAAPDGRLLLHRLLGYCVRDGRLACVTRGDAAPNHDLPVAPDRLLGRTLERPAPGARLRAMGAFLCLASRRLVGPVRSVRPARG